MLSIGFRVDFEHACGVGRCRSMTIRGERRNGEVLITVDGALLDWRSSQAVRNHSPTGPAWGLRRLGPGPVRAGHPAGGDRPSDGRAVLPAVQMERPRADLGGPLVAGRRRCPRLAGVGGGDGRLRGPGGGDVSGQRLLGAHLPVVHPERRETMAGECLGCLTQFAIDVRLPLPATCPDCGADVLSRADIEGPGHAAHSRGRSCALPAQCRTPCPTSRRAMCGKAAGLGSVLRR